MKTNLIQITTHSHPILDKLIAVWKEMISALIRIKAKSNAERNLPKPQGDDLMRYLGFFKEKVQECIRQIDGILKIVPLLYYVKQLRDDRNKIVHDCQNKINELRAKLIEISHSANSPEYKLIGIGSIILFFLFILLAIGEALFGFRPFLYLTGNFTASVIITTVFAGIWAMGAEKFSAYWGLGVGLKRFIRRLLMVIFCTIIFYGIAHLRVLERACSKAIMNDEIIPGFFDVNIIEVIVLTCIGWLFFLGAVWLAQHSPSNEQLKEVIIQRMNRVTAWRIERQIKKLEEIIVRVNENVALEEHKAISLLNIRVQGIRNVEGYLKYLIEEFKESNHSLRPDGIYPDCFDKPLVFDIDTSIPNINKDIEGLIIDLNRQNPAA